MPVSRTQSIIAAMMLGVIALLLVWSTTMWRRDEPAPGDVLEMLIGAMSTRALVPRLTGGFGYAPVSTPRGAGAEATLAITLATLEAERLVAMHPSAEHVALLGKARLLNGELDRAVMDLQRAARDEPSNASIRSDLAAAYLARASLGKHDDAVRGLDAALQARSLDPTLPEAAFNAAYALTLNHLNDQARRAWMDYVTRDARSPWADEARASAARLLPRKDWAVLRSAILAGDRDAESDAIEHFPGAVRDLIEFTLLPNWAMTYPGGCEAWATARRLARQLHARGGDPFAHETLEALATGRRCPRAGKALREGLSALAEGRRLMDLADFGAALPFLRRSADLLGAARSPMRYWAEVHLAYMHYQMADSSTAKALTRRPATFATRRRYPALLARARFVEGLSTLDRPDEALRLFGAAIEQYNSIGERASARATASAAADLARSTGDEAESWRLIGVALATVQEEPSAVRRYLSFYNAALFARSVGMLEAALSFQEEAVVAARECAELGALAQAFAQRAFVLIKLGREREAADDIARAKLELAKFRKSPHAHYQAELDTIEAALRLPDDPGLAHTLLARAADVFARTAPWFVVDVHVAMGRAALQQGRYEDAKRVLATGIDSFEKRRSRIGDDDLRISYFGTARNLYQDYIQLLLAQGDALGAFQYSDRVRARALDEAGRDTGETSPVGIRDIQDVIGPSAAFLAFHISGDELITWCIANGQLRLHRTPLTAGELERALQILKSSGSSIAEEVEASSALHERLLGRFRGSLTGISTVYLSLDGALHGVPFAQLIDRARNRRLVEDMSITVVPSASWLLWQSSRAAVSPPPGSVDILAIGNPPDVTAVLPSLPHAEQEALRAANAYTSYEILRGASATRAEFLKRAPRARVIHFAGHAVQNGASPALSHLVMAAESGSDDGRLRAATIARLRLPHTDLVILAACSTARGVVRFGEGPMTLGRPFLVAGARAVAATLWDVDDAATARLLSRMHEALRAGHRPADALRHAQLALLRSSEATDRQPHRWAGFVLIGSQTPKGEMHE